jgi:predicted metal-dependent hydrolase
MDRKVLKYAGRILGENHAQINVTYKVSKRCWGYWSPDGSLTFNIATIKTPMSCIEYVIVHELCHLQFPNHDRLFYHSMHQILPDWKARKEKLELFGLK